MSARPWMPLYVGDYLRDTRRLNAAEHGAYLLLIMEYWQAGHLPDDDVLLARIGCMSDREWKRAKPIIGPFFDEGWRHKRIDWEIEKANAKSAKRAEAGKRGGKTTANAKQLLQQTAQQNGSKKAANGQASSTVTELSTESSTIRTKPARRRLSYSDAFTEFWKAYPTDELMSKSKALWGWNQLSPEEQASAFAAIPAFRAYCKSHPDYRPVHAVRFLTEGRFDGFAAAAERAASQVYIKRGTPAWTAWEHHTGKTLPVDKTGGWHFPSEYPPSV